jgi:hypothetical protein
VVRPKVLQAVRPQRDTASAILPDSSAKLMLRLAILAVLTAA